MKLITNRIIHDTIESDLVYPGLHDYKWICKVDKDFVKDQLQDEFGVSRINNKYVIRMSTGQMWYQHDGSTWLIEENNT